MMGLWSINNRYSASLIHLTGSALVALLVIAIVFGVWYPGVLADATGVTKIFFLVLIVDVCLGPLLTLIVFNVEKRELRRDLLIILIFQLAALFYGIYTVGVVRPVYIVFAIDRFELVYASDVTPEKLQHISNDEFKSVPWLGPKWVSAQLPDDVDERNKLLFSAASGGDDLAQTPRYYMPYDSSREEVIKRSLPLKKLRQYNLSNLDGYNKLIDRYSSDFSNYAYLPLKTDTMNLVVIIEKSTADVMEMVELKPWG